MSGGRFEPLLKSDPCGRMSKCERDRPAHPARSAAMHRRGKSVRSAQSPCDRDSKLNHGRRGASAAPDYSGQTARNRAAYWTRRFISGTSGRHERHEAQDRGDEGGESDVADPERISVARTVRKVRTLVVRWWSVPTELASERRESSTPSRRCVAGIPGLHMRSSR